MNKKEAEKLIRKKFGFPEGKQTSKNLNTPFISITGNTSSRILNHWEKTGLIDDRREKKQGWRKYSPVEVVWIEIIQALRLFNFSLENILTLKKEFTFKADATDDSFMPLLEIVIWEKLINPGPLRLKIRPNGHTVPSDGLPIGLTDADESDGHFIQIDLFLIILKIFPDLRASDKRFTMDDLNQAEKELLVMIRTGQYYGFEIETKDGKIKFLNASELIEDEKLFREIANEYPYQEITTKIKDGKEASKKRTLRIKY